MNEMTCAECGCTTLRRSPSQRYCSTCSGARDDARKRDWAKRNRKPSDPVALAEKYARDKSAIVTAGAAISQDNRASIGWDPQEHQPSHTLVRVAVPFDYAASKNAVWRHGRGGHVFARAESVAFRAGLAEALRASDARWFQGKLWIDIYVEKSNHRGDAINALDVVCDAVKDATGVDDRWYSILRLDWSIVKENPRIYVGVRQSVIEHHQVCSHCGRALTLEHFHKNRGTNLGVGRQCRDCASARKKGRAA